MTGETFGLKVLDALTHGDPLPEEFDGYAVAWSYDLAPGDDDGIDELHYGIEVWTILGEVYAGVYLRGIARNEQVALFVLDSVQVEALRDRWEAIYAWPYNGELDAIAA